MFTRELQQELGYIESQDQGQSRSAGPHWTLSDLTLTYAESLESWLVEYHLQVGKAVCPHVISKVYPAPQPSNVVNQGLQ